MFHELTDRFTNFVCDKNFDQFAQLFVEDAWKKPIGHSIVEHIIVVHGFGT